MNNKLPSMHATKRPTTNNETNNETNNGTNTTYTATEAKKRNLTQ